MIEFFAIIMSHVLLLGVMVRGARLAQEEQDKEAVDELKRSGK
jgi:hypothetical protein